MCETVYNTQLVIDSDFTDFYDDKASKVGITYERKFNKCKQRGSALKYLRSLGVKTIEIKQVSSYSFLDGPLVVYTDPRKHGGQGKKILNYEEAIENYINFPASRYLENDGYTIKVLQIGKRRFNLLFKKDVNDISLNMGELVKITELEPSYNNIFLLPIFSIDYIVVDGEMVATDFNEVENLGALGIDKYMTKREICDEIRGALIAYNKI